MVARVHGIEIFSWYLEGKPSQEGFHITIALYVWFIEAEGLENTQIL